MSSLSRHELELEKSLARTLKRNDPFSNAVLNARWQGEPDKTIIESLKSIEERSNQDTPASEHMPLNFVGPLTRERNDCEACLAMRLRCKNKLSLKCEHSREQDSIEHIPEDIIKRHRLTVDEIREIPQFASYDPGPTNRALYLKNLAKSVDEQDLKQLFARFHATEYAVLKGRMRGQAFVTFQGKISLRNAYVLLSAMRTLLVLLSDVYSASNALNLVNGFNLKGKPIIILFKRSSKVLS